jgi:MtN3 and saliva related transmembrane protein
MSKSIFGWIASGITVIYKIPQIIKLYKTKKSDDLSILSLFMQLIGYIFYILHGISINDLPIIFMGSGALFENIIVMAMYYIYKEDNIEDEPNN